MKITSTKDDPGFHRARQIADRLMSRVDGDTSKYAEGWRHALEEVVHRINWELQNKADDFNIWRELAEAAEQAQLDDPPPR